MSHPFSGLEGAYANYLEILNSIQQEANDLWSVMKREKSTDAKMEMGVQMQYLIMRHDGVIDKIKEMRKKLNADERLTIDYWFSKYRKPIGETYVIN